MTPEIIQKKGKHSYSSAFILNYYNRTADSFIRQGGNKVEGFSLHVYDSNLNPSSTESSSSEPTEPTSEIPEGEKGTGEVPPSAVPPTKGDKARGITYTFEVSFIHFLSRCHVLFL